MSKTPRKIQSRLMIYYSSINDSDWRSWDSNRDQKKIKKYGLFSQKSSKNARQPALPISNVTHSMSHLSSLDNDFLRFLAKNRNIKNLTLKMTDYSWIDETSRSHWRHREPELNNFP